MRLVPSRSTRRITLLKVMLLLAMFFIPEFAAAGNPRDPELTLPASHWEMVAGAGACGGGWWLMADKDERVNKKRRFNHALNGDMRKMLRPVNLSAAERRIVTGAAAVAAVGTAASRGDTAPTASATAAAASAATVSTKSGQGRTVAARIPSSSAPPDDRHSDSSSDSSDSSNDDRGNDDRDPPSDHDGGAGSRAAVEPNTKWPLSPPFTGDTLPRLPIPVTRPTARTTPLSDADVVVARHLEGRSAAARDGIVRDFSRVASIAAEAGRAERDAELSVTLLAMESRGAVAPEIRQALLGCRPKANLGTILSPDMKALDKAFTEAGMSVPKFREIQVSCA